MFSCSWLEISYLLANVFQVDSMLQNLEKEIDDVDAKIGDHWRILDRWIAVFRLVILIKTICLMITFGLWHFLFHTSHSFGCTYKYLEYNSVKTILNRGRSWGNVVPFSYCLIYPVTSMQWCKQKFVHPEWFSCCKFEWHLCYYPLKMNWWNINHEPCSRTLPYHEWK